ncbi:hypothetical protein [Sanguibacter gelidistatuariae]|nr:hypothetical protein [Sanguibacter gelidistatuariae]
MSELGWGKVPTLKVAAAAAADPLVWPSAPPTGATQPAFAAES